MKVAIVSITNSEWSSGTSCVRTIFPINNGKMSRTEGHNDMSSNILLQLLLTTCPSQIVSVTLLKIRHQ